VDLADVDQEKAQALKLKEVRGAVITLIDHDAPAGKIGLKVNDVVLQLNGQIVEGSEQLRRMLREIPAGHKVSLEISRDGNVQTLAVELANRKVMEHEVWTRIGAGGDVFGSGPGMAMMGEGDSPLPSGFHVPFFGSSLNGRERRSDGETGGAQKRGRRGGAEGLRRDSQGGAERHCHAGRLGARAALQPG
jgi:membrane-associated protease RseP (regulator of RpoE activity)